MANVLINESTMTDIADAIREKLGVSDTYKPAEMPDAIASIGGGGGEGGNDPVAVRLATRPSNWPYIPTSLEMANTSSPYYEGGNCIYKLYNASGIKCTPAFNLTGSNMVGKVYKYNDTTLVSEANLALVSGDNRFTFDENDADWDSYNFIVIKLTGGITALNNNIAPIYKGMTILAEISTELIEENESGMFTVGIFYSPKKLQYLSSNAKRTGLVTSIRGGTPSLVAIAELNTTDITDMQFMFFQAYSLRSVCLFDTSNVIYTQSMFAYCSSLIDVPLFDTSKVKNASSMFTYCSSLKRVPSFNLQSATTLSSMFAYCPSLNEVPLFNTSSVQTITSMFSNCHALIELPVFNLEHVTNINSAFASCLSLQKIVLDLLSTSAIGNMMSSCLSLDTIEIANFKASTSSSSTTSIFNNCYSLRKIIIRSFSSTAINADAFTNCYHLLGTVNANYNPNGDKDCFIYVPANMVDTLKAASVWSNYASQIRSIDELEA